MAASEEAYGIERPSLLNHMVNLHEKLAAVPKDLFCNMVWISNALCPSISETMLHGLVYKVRKSILKIDVEFVNKAQGDKGYLVMKTSLKEMGEIVAKETIDAYLFSSCRCNMGFYEIDFGWGKPTWVNGDLEADGFLEYMNCVNLVATRCGQGIEAWVSLDKEQMNISVKP